VHLRLTGFVRTVVSLSQSESDCSETGMRAGEEAWVDDVEAGIVRVVAKVEEAVRWRACTQTNFAPSYLNADVK
jgi:hypothetical protein